MTYFSRALIVAVLVMLFIWAAVPLEGAGTTDLAVMRLMARLRADWPGVTAIAFGLTSLGGTYVTLSLASAASLYLLRRRQPAHALLIAATVLVERALVVALKNWIGRPRPALDVNWLPQSLAFPSGHAANSMTAFLAIALLAASPRLRRTAAIAAITLSVTVGLTRIYLGVHWPSDVVGGWALGLLTVGAALAIGERSGVLPAEPQHQIVGGHRPPLDEEKPL